MTAPVLAAQSWPTNAHLLADVARLWIPVEGTVLDVTYGRGIWWKQFHPATLVTHDLRSDGVDFRQLPEADSTFDVVAFDPPYVCTGGRETSTISDFNERFGLHTTPRTPAELDNYIGAGLAECARVVKPHGVVLVKAMDYVWSGRYHPATHHLMVRAFGLGLEIIDRFEMVGQVRPQPGGRRQVHARRNLSTLSVFRKPIASKSRRPKPRRAEVT